MSRFPSLRIEGGLISFDLIERIADGEATGQKPVDFGLPARAHFLDEVADAWAAAKRYWEGFRSRLEQLPDEDLATSVTRDGWVIPLMSLFGYELAYRQKAHLVDGLTFAISHGADPGDDAPPVHVVGWRQELGKLPPSGRPRLAPHVLLQEYLNRTEHLWGVVTNGRILRVLRDSQLLSRQAYIEFDLEAMFGGERLSDFALLWRLVHRTRLPRGMDDAPECLLEHYYAASVEQGGRVRERLRDGVEKALGIFGNGFLSQPENGALRELVRAGDLRPESLYRDLLRLVYRLLFLMVAEERGLISPSPVYREHYSLDRLRRLADLRLPDEGHRDLWLSLQSAFELFRREELGSLLEVPPLNGELFARTELDRCSLANRDLLAAVRELSTYAEDARSPRRRVNYSALDVEELGSVYESLLDYHPAVIEQGGKLVFRLVWGTERKTTGSYYTPPELVNELIKSALVPVMEERLGKARGREEKERALLSIRVCDPACGSGHFLLAAARRLGKELARMRTGDEEPAPEEVRAAVREVIGHCIYGVDKNPLAVDLCRVALWIEGHAEGKPLTFLDHRVRCGDSLVGVFDLKALEQGIPDEAFNPVSGDDRALARSLKKDNKAERTERVGWLSMDFEAAGEVPGLAEAYRALAEIPDDTPEQVRRKQEAYEGLRGEGGRWWRDQASCHLWTAAFFAEITAEAYEGKAVPTTETLRNHLGNPASIDPRYVGRAWELAQRHRFFHWPLEFPEVFEAGGFDVVLCNPPWELIQLQEEEFFAQRDPEIASAPNSAARTRMIRELQESNPSLWQEYRKALHLADATRKFLRSSGRFKLTSSGRINYYSVFSELFSGLVNASGRAGVVVPTGIATDDTNKVFFSHLVESGRLASLYDFENREKMFPAVDSRQKFSLLTLRGGGSHERGPARFAFFLTRAEQLKDPRRVFELTASDFALLNPNTRTCPIFRTRQDAELTKYIYERVPVLVNEATGENPWGVTFKQGLFNMSSDSHLFRTRAELEQAGFRLFGNRFIKGEGEDQEVWLPLYEAKMIHQFDHRFGTYEGMEARTNAQIPTPNTEQHADCDYVTLPWYWVSLPEINRQIINYHNSWFLGYRRIVRATDEKTTIATIIPRYGAGDVLPICLFNENGASFTIALIENFNALCFDYSARQKVSGIHLDFHYIKQLPIVPREMLDEEYSSYITPKILELIYASWDIKPFADDVWREADEGLREAIRWQWEENKQATGGHAWDPPEWAEIADDGIPLPPFKWDEDRRARLRAELDAIYARLYGLNRKQLRYILDPADLTEKELENILDDYEEVDDPLDEEAYLRRCEASTFPGETFRVLKEKEIKQYGFYRTRHLVLKAWERMYVQNE